MTIAAAPGMPVSRVPELDGMRGLAIGLILLWHYGAGMVPHDESPEWLRTLARVLGFAWNGVDMFFVLSGYLIGGILMDHRTAPNLYKVFYIRRFCRIMPLYVLWLGLFFGALALSPSARFNWLFDHPLPHWGYLVYGQNMTAWWADRFGPNWVGITWSLAIEEQFYILLPVLIRVLPMGWMPYVCGAAILSAFPLRLITGAALPDHQWATLFPIWCRWDALFTGVLLAWMRRQEWWASTGSREGMAYGWMLFLGTLAWMLGLSAVGMTDPSHLHIRTYGYTVIAACYGAMLFLVLHGTVLTRIFSTGPLVFLGTVSYGLYMFHQGVLGLVHGSVFGAPPRLASVPQALVTLLSLALTVLLARWSYRYFENRWVRWGHGWKYGESNFRTDCRE